MSFFLRATPRKASWRRQIIVGLVEVSPAGHGGGALAVTHTELIRELWTGPPDREQ